MSYKKKNVVDGLDYEPMKEPRYGEIATFMRAPLAESLADVDIGLIGVPTDLGVTNRPGARHGPREIRNSSSLMRAFNLGLRVNPYELCRIADLGDVRLPNRYDLEAQTAQIADYYRLVHEAKVIPVSAGGDHSITFPILPGDRGRWTDWHGAYRRPLRHLGRVLRFKVHARCAFPVGGRARTAGPQAHHPDRHTRRAEFDGRHQLLPLDHGMRVVFMEEFAKLGVEGVIAEARRVVGSGPTYISFDVDGLDPVYAPGTGTPEVGGITTARRSAAPARTARRARTWSAAMSSRSRRPYDPDGQHGAGGRDDDVRDHLPDCRPLVGQQKLRIAAGRGVHSMGGGD